LNDRCSVELYPAFAEIEFITPAHKGRLPPACCGIQTIGSLNGIQAPRITDLLRLPPWHPRSNRLWPPAMK
jgi:hypothetical protein